MATKTAARRPAVPPGTASDFLVIGAGLAGLAAAARLGSRATVLEAERDAGGLVRTVCFDGYWFDLVVHLLYLPDQPTLQYVKELAGDVLAPCPPDAWVETAGGTVRYPFQFHLNELPEPAASRCRDDFIALHSKEAAPPQNYEEMLRYAFGEGMCELFYLPYNRKMWRRPLSELATSGFHWNLQRPRLEDVVGGDGNARAYNQAGWYPRPPAGSPMRGMGYISERLRDACHDIRFNHRVTGIDLGKKAVTVRHGTNQLVFRFDQRCLLTMPLPAAIRACRDVPGDLASAVGKLEWNRVRSVGLNIRGPRPAGTGCFRYYSDESLAFTRLIFLHEFDPGMAPPDGWPLLVEITESTRGAPPSPEALHARVLQDINRLGLLPPGSEVTAINSWIIDPAYVVFTPDSRDIVTAANEFLMAHGVMPLGRYGRWEYSSMGQVIRDGRALAGQLLEQCGIPA